MFYFALKQYPVDGGVMVTASHNPAEYNGFKLMFGNYPITAEEIKELEIRVCELRSADSEGQGQQETALGMNCSAGDMKLGETIDPREAYSRYIKDFGLKGGLRIVVDCCNGKTGLFYPEMETLKEQLNLSKKNNVSGDRVDLSIRFVSEGDILLDDASVMTITLPAGMDRKRAIEEAMRQLQAMKLCETENR